METDRKNLSERWLEALCPGLCDPSSGTVEVENSHPKGTKPRMRDWGMEEPSCLKASLPVLNQDASYFCGIGGLGGDGGSWRCPREMLRSLQALLKAWSLSVRDGIRTQEAPRDSRWGAKDWPRLGSTRDLALENCASWLSGNFS